MYILYLDGSGSIKNPGERYFVLAGVAAFERQIDHLIAEADRFVGALHLDADDAVELHGSVMANGSKRPWKGMVRKRRLEVIDQALGLLADAHDSIAAFAVAVDKNAVSPEDSVEYAFEEICSRFNHFLNRIWNRRGERHRGLIVMDESHYENALQTLARRFRAEGTRWGRLRNLPEVPLFVDSRASRLVQLADLLAWAVWRRYEHGDTRYFDRIANRFDREGGVLHGLVHRRSAADDCHCPACLSRALAAGAPRLVRLSA